MAFSIDLRDNNFKATTKDCGQNVSPTRAVPFNTA